MGKHLKIEAPMNFADILKENITAHNSINGVNQPNY